MHITNRSACLEQFFILNRRGIFFFFKNGMSLGLVVLEEKLLMLMCTPMPQSDGIMLADSQVS